jgi:hypothetical protein
MPSFYDGTLRTARFQYMVKGARQVGVIYVTTRILPGETMCQLQVRAAKMASKRSGDAAPQLVRDNLNGGSF